MLHLYLGPMYAGKTTKLLSLYHEKGGQILDYSETETALGSVTNHNGVTAQCISLSRLLSYTGSSNILYINEAQFFPDLLDFIKRNEQNTLYLFGLDGDFQRNPMGQILMTIPLCDTVEKLTGKCNQCTNASLFSKRITQEKQQYLLDENAYVPLCRTCYLNYNDSI